jgi:hypothetical protein
VASPISPEVELLVQPLKKIWQERTISSSILHSFTCTGSVREAPSWIRRTIVLQSVSLQAARNGISFYVLCCWVSTLVSILT